MGEPGGEDCKIQSCDAETRQLLETALKEPGATDLEKVASVIVDGSLQGCAFSEEMEHHLSREQARRSEWLLAGTELTAAVPGLGAAVSPVPAGMCRLCPLYLQPLCQPEGEQNPLMAQVTPV